MRITSKGQVTIPQDIREKYGLLPGTEIAFLVDGDAVRIVKQPGRDTRGRQVIERLRGRGTVSMTTDEILAYTRGA